MQDVDDVLTTYGDFVSHVVHDTSQQLSTLLDTAKGMRDEPERWDRVLRKWFPRVRQRDPEWFVSLARHRVRADHALLMYVGSSSKFFSLNSLTVGEIVERLAVSLDRHGRNFYAPRIGRVDPGPIVCCPGIVVTWVLAAMLFRFPVASGPLPVTVEARTLKDRGKRESVRFALRTESPVTRESLELVEITDDKRWDVWHHSWAFAEATSRKYSGGCNSQIRDDGRMAAFLNLPVRVGRRKRSR